MYWTHMTEIVLLCFQVQRPSLSQDSEFYMSSKLISDFAGKTEPRPSDRVVYAAGAFDMFRILFPCADPVWG